MSSLDVYAWSCPRSRWDRRLHGLPLPLPAPPAPPPAPAADVVEEEVEDLACRKLITCFMIALTVTASDDNDEDEDEAPPLRPAAAAVSAATECVCATYL